MLLVHMLLGYTAVVFSIAYVLLLGNCGFHRNGLVGKLRWVLVKTFPDLLARICPRIIKSAYDKVVRYFVYERTCAFQLLYATILSAGYVILFNDMMPTMTKMNFPNALIVVQLVLLAADLAAFAASCLKDPGSIYPGNHARYLGCYEFDNRFYTRGNECKSCRFSKPARSKHCSVCNVCIHRFDHHCVWINQCVGGHNYTHFLTFLFTNIVHAAHGLFIVWVYLVAMVVMLKLNKMHYLDSDGVQQPVTWVLIIQHLLFTYPRIITLFIFMFVSLCTLSTFLGFHVYLVCTNQTTNEFYKRWSGEAPPVGALVAQAESSKEKAPAFKRKKAKLKDQTYMFNKRNKYGRGLLRNVYEVLRPSSVFMKDGPLAESYETPGNAATPVANGAKKSKRKKNR